MPNKLASALCLLMWHFIVSVGKIPADKRIGLAVVDIDGLHELAFPCYRVEDHWVHAESKIKVDVRPTHWREWSE
jgi:hypothetical protein